MTVEIGYALCSAVFAAALLFGAVAGPAFLFALPAGVGGTLVAVGTVAAVALFGVRVVSVLMRFRRPAQVPDDVDRPSRPGRTDSDS
ncbi:hypothetical protein SZN_31624 [Streptomyces zinciresistens K42]|uniref:Uncharacterized protein n=2 Tax=Streptomyces TaxID=1883 RepID=G2GLD9_9ACTN|nr:hypothetical protein SZN_31624 [Streptomyces zinciresistens K42]